MASTTIRSRGRLTPVPTHPRWRSVRLNPYGYATVMLVLFLGTIQLGQALGAWTTSGRITGSGEPIVATGLNPDEIKGWMTIQEVSTAYAVPADAFYTRFQVPADVPVTTAFKDLEKSVPDFSTEDVRAWLRELLSQPPGQ